MHIENATLNELAQELDKANVAMMLSLSSKEQRKWSRYRNAITAEIDRRSPVQDISDDELAKELTEFCD